MGVSSFRFIFLHVMAPDALRDNGSPFPPDQIHGEQDEHAFVTYVDPQVVFR